MPRGQSPASNMKARYESLNRQLDNVEKDLNKGRLKKIARKIKTLFKGEAAVQDAAEAKKLGQRAVSSKHYSLMKRVEKIEKNMRRQENMKGVVRRAAKKAMK